MTDKITAMTVSPVVNSAGANVGQSITADGNSGYVTRWDTRSQSFVVQGSYTTDSASAARPIFIVVSVGNEANSYDFNVAAPASRTSPGTKDFSVVLPASTLTVGQKMFVTVRLVSKPASSPGWNYYSLTEDTRSQSFWMNRRPATPNILTPSSGISMVADVGDYEEMSWDFADEDQVGSANTPLLRDYGGWQVQYRPSPTVAAPDPEWINPTLHLFTSEVEAAPGAPKPADKPLGFQNRRAWTLRLDQTFSENDYTTAKDRIRIVADATGNAAVTDGDIKELWLGPGAWDVRVRVFDRASADGKRDSSGVPISYLTTPENAPTNSVSSWSSPVTVYIVGNSSPPILGEPGFDEAVYGSVRFDWQFQSPVGGRTQRDWNVVVREVGETTWSVLGANTVPFDGASSFIYENGASAYTLVPGTHYEWSSKTRDNAFWTSEYATPQSFWYTAAPETGPELPLPLLTLPDPGLGCGVNRVYVYRRGGNIRVGEITEMTQVVWTRTRDDISTCDITIKGWSQDCGTLLKDLRSWQYELVVFRDNGTRTDRVWEGPIVRISYESDTVSIEAKDVMGYVYRRILRQGYNNSYRVRGRTYYEGGGIKDPGVVVSRPSPVTNRARQIIQNALAYDDPNVLQYMWVLSRADDANQSRVVPAWSRTAWQEVDDLAAKAGLDYTTVGRRIMLWDTHNPVGTLPEMRDSDFDSPPVVTEYGMQLANVYGVTNANGIYGSATRNPPKYYGYVEMLISAWGESDEGGATETLTAEAQKELEESLTTQAERGIGQRFPTPLVVRVPDNSTLSPDLNIGINQLVPGVHIPLLSDNTLRRVRQVQKLDSVRVAQTETGETVQVTMSPAPTSRDYDPDDDQGGDDG